MNFYCLGFLAVLFQLISLTDSLSHRSFCHPTSHLPIPTASSQYSHLHTLPAPYFLLAQLRRPSSHKSCPLLLAFLLFLSGDIQPNPGPANRHLTVYSLNIRSLFQENRSPHIQDVIHANNPDVFALTETWHNPHTTTPAQLAEATPRGFQLFSIPRPHSICGGGVAILCKDHLSPTPLELPSYHSFEAISINLTGLPRQLTIFNIYRPPDSSSYSQPFTAFLDEFTSFLTLATSLPHFVITGDFNIHCNDTFNHQAAQFLSILSDFNLAQHVTFPTHTNGNTLDLLITPISLSIPTTVSSLPATPSDHFALLSSFDISAPSPRPPVTRSFRRINSINIQNFISDLSASQLIVSPPPSLVDLVNCYNSTLTSILDKHAPLISKVIHSSNSNPWFTPALKALKRTRRKLERQWKSLPTLPNLTALRKASNTYHNAILAAKKLYHSQLISANHASPRQLWKTINTLLHRSAVLSLPNFQSASSIAQQFSTFFSDKVTRLRACIHPVNQSPHLPQPSGAPPSLAQFRFTDVDEITKLVLQSPNPTTDQFQTCHSCRSLQNGSSRTAYLSTSTRIHCSVNSSLHTPCSTPLNLCSSLSTIPSSRPSPTNK